MEWTAVHHAVAPTHELGLCAFPGHTSLAEWDLGPAPGPVPPAAQHPQPASLSGSSWEARCLRKHRRRRSADEYVRQQPSAGSWHTHTTVTVRSPQRVPGQEEETGGGDPGARRQPQPPGRVRGPAPGSGAPGSGAPGGALLPGDGGGSAEASGDRKQDHAGGRRRGPGSGGGAGAPAAGAGPLRQSEGRSAAWHGRHPATHRGPVCESLLYGAGVVAAARGPLLSQAQGLPAQTAQTADGRSAEPRPASTPQPGAPLWRGGHGDGAVSSRSSPHLRTACSDTWVRAVASQCMLELCCCVQKVPFECISTNSVAWPMNLYVVLILPSIKDSPMIWAAGAFLH